MRVGINLAAGADFLEKKEFGLRIFGFGWQEVGNSGVVSLEYGVQVALLIQQGMNEAMSTASSNDGGSRTATSHFPPEEIIFGRSASMSAMRQMIEKISRSDVPIVLQGEGGTGKELLARWIHAHSLCSKGAFVKVNCAAIPNQLLESELFGYERGAFTGAHSSKSGRVEFADKGTLFLDEIADLDLSLQGKILHFLQDGTFCRLGGDTERVIKTRLLCATNRNLEQQIKIGAFRADLFYRINVIQLRLPRLRDRREDIPELAEYLRIQYESQFGRKSEPFCPETLDYLQNMDWPGNLRELSNGVARYVLIGTDGLAGRDLSATRESACAESKTEKQGIPLKHLARQAIRETERTIILQALRANQWNRRKTAQALKISYRALIYKIAEAGLSSKSARSPGIGRATDATRE